jgi:hypothetical protein
MTPVYQTESSGRDARRSMGPRTAAGKERKRLNELKHGLRAESAVLPDEDAESFAKHRDERIAALQPCDVIEFDLASMYALATWKRYRCIRAETGLIASNMQCADLEAAKLEQLDVISLGRRLFWDRRGDFRFYPHGCYNGGPRTSSPDGPDDPDDPERLLVELESNITGCRWLLDRWAELKERLQPGQSWHPHEKFKAIRLLGKQPLDAADEPVVAQIFLASHVTDPLYGNPFRELELEFDPKSNELMRFQRRLNDRPWHALRPKNESEAREALARLVEKATARLEKLAAEHEARAAIYGAKARCRLAFDSSNEAERLRRHERACIRDMFRALNQIALRRLDDQELSSLGALSEEGLRPRPSIESNGASRVVFGGETQGPAGDMELGRVSLAIDSSSSADQILAVPLTADNMPRTTGTAPLATGKKRVPRTKRSTTKRTKKQQSAKAATQSKADG